MKKNINTLLFIIIIITFVLICPLKIYALSEQTNFVDVNEIKSLEDEHLAFNNENTLSTDTTNLTPSKNSDYSSRDYVIDKYDIDIIVHENNVFDITENITAYFNVPKHGIYRTIPTINKITRLDGSTSSNHVQIAKVSANKKYAIGSENDNYIIKIGDEAESLIGEQKYVIKYSYDIGKDPLKNGDELYYNIIGTEWNTVIGNITFSITMPKEFDSSKLGFSSGTIGEINNNVQYNVSGNKITGSYNGILNTGEGITVRCELPEDYFVGAGFKMNTIDCIIFSTPIVFLIISLILWNKYGRDEKEAETIEFYPPKGFNSLEVGLLYKGKANNVDVTSLLIYLANEGYIKIEENEKKFSLFKNNNYKIIKLKDYDGNNKNEYRFFYGLFPKHLSGEDAVYEVTSKDLKNNFYNTVTTILMDINCKSNKTAIFEETSLNKKKSVLWMIIIAYLLITVQPVLAYGDEIAFIFAALFPAIGFYAIIDNIFKDNKKNIKLNIIKIILLVVIFCYVPLKFIMLPLLKQNTFYLIGYILGITCIIGMIICRRNFSKRTPYGKEILGKILGFKHYLETTKKEELEEMVAKNPTYFYDVLPYTYVLGVSDTWIKKFESITLKSPLWYSNVSGFSLMTFSLFMNNTMPSIHISMVSSPSSSGSSSGGGSSGGGSGGGGGGSW